MQRNRNENNRDWNCKSKEESLFSIGSFQGIKIERIGSYNLKFRGKKIAMHRNFDSRKLLLRCIEFEERKLRCIEIYSFLENPFIFRKFVFQKGTDGLAPRPPEALLVNFVGNGLSRPPSSKGRNCMYIYTYILNRRHKVG